MAALSCQVSPNRYATLPGGSANRRDAGIQVDFAEDLVTDLGFRLRASVQVLTPSAVVWSQTIAMSAGN
jgi:hypothetical protein